MAALFAAAMSFTPALAHLGHAHAGPHVADHHVDAMTASINPASPIGSLTARQTAPLVHISSVVVKIGQRLAPGAYKVRWHAASTDAHKSQGSFGFEVRP